MREIQTIACHVLGLTSKEVNNTGTPQSSEGPRLSDGEGQRSLGSEAEAPDNDGDIYPPLDIHEDLCGWYNQGDLGLGYLWEMNSGQ